MQTPNSFKFRGKSYGIETIFSVAEARDEVYNAFGKEVSFLTKLVKLGFIVDGDSVFHPAHWIPLRGQERNGMQTHKYVTSKGVTRFGEGNNNPFKKNKMINKF